jgi:DNA-binding XRE family transcriptional regulator
VLPNALTLTTLILESLVVQPPGLPGTAIRFMRKALRLTAQTLAERIGTTREEVSRWENDRVAISPHFELKLRLEVIDGLFSHRPVLRQNVVAAMTATNDAKGASRQVIIDASPHYPPHVLPLPEEKPISANRARVEIEH